MLVIIVVAQLPVLFFFMQEQLVSSCSESAGGRTSLLEAALCRVDDHWLKKFYLPDETYVNKNCNSHYLLLSKLGQGAEMSCPLPFPPPPPHPFLQSLIEPQRPSPLGKATLWWRGPWSNLSLPPHPVQGPLGMNATLCFMLGGRDMDRRSPSGLKLRLVVLQSWYPCKLQFWCELSVDIYKNNMWQSRAEIEHYSVTYFDHITMFEVL